MAKPRSKRAFREYLKTGRWFLCVECLLLPCSKLRVVGSIIERELPSDKALLSPLPRRKDRRARANLQRLVTTSRALVAIYNTQPRWSLRDIKARSLGQALEIVHEFLQFASFASDNFGWQWEDPSKHEDWRRHAWKHTDYNALESIIGAGWLVETEKVKSSRRTQEIQELCRGAIRKDPAAVARLGALFPAEEDKRSIFEHVLPPAERPREMPSPADLAAELVDIVWRSPDSAEADQARHGLKVLVSRRAIRGAAPQRGRPPMQYTSFLVSHVFKVSYALAKQLREVDQFLGNYEAFGPKRMHHIRQFYPWLGNIPAVELVQLLESRPVSAACQIASQALGLSSSKIEKTVYQR